MNYKRTIGIIMSLSLSLPVLAIETNEGLSEFRYECLRYEPDKYSHWDTDSHHRIDDGTLEAIPEKVIHCQIITDEVSKKEGFSEDQVFKGIVSPTSFTGDTRSIQMLMRGLSYIEQVSVSEDIFRIVVNTALTAVRPSEDPKDIVRRINHLARHRTVVLASLINTIERTQPQMLNEILPDLYQIAKLDWNSETRALAVAAVTYIESDKKKKQDFLHWVRSKDGSRMFAAHPNGSFEYVEMDEKTLKRSQFVRRFAHALYMNNLFTNFGSFSEFWDSIDLFQGQQILSGPSSDKDVLSEQGVY